MSASPGWYPDPSNPGMEHWWDGNQYTHSQPRQHSTMPAPYVGMARPADVSPKSRTVASILGFFLGGLGVDRFYLGNIGMGVAKLLLGWATAGLWPLIDWIIIISGQAHDGDGYAVTRWE